MYTLPFATVGGTNFAKLPMLSRVAFCWLSQSSVPPTFEAS